MVALGSTWYASRVGHSPDIGAAVVVVGVIGGVFGYLVGSERAFALRLAAQTALCQAQIERNTRALAAALGKALPPPIPRDA